MPHRQLHTVLCAGRTELTCARTHTKSHQHTNGSYSHSDNSPKCMHMAHTGDSSGDDGGGCVGDDGNAAIDSASCSVLVCERCEKKRACAQREGASEPKTAASTQPLSLAAPARPRRALGVAIDIGSGGEGGGNLRTGGRRLRAASPCPQGCWVNVKLCVRTLGLTLPSGYC